MTIDSFGKDLPPQIGKNTDSPASREGDPSILLSAGDVKPGFETKNLFQKQALLAAGETFFPLRTAIRNGEFTSEMVDHDDRLTSEWKLFYKHLAQVMGKDMDACGTIVEIARGQLKLKNLNQDEIERMLPARLFEMAFGKPTKGVILMEGRNVLTFVVEGHKDYAIARGKNVLEVGTAVGFLDRSGKYHVGKEEMTAPTAVVRFGLNYQGAAAHEWGHNMQYQTEIAMALAQGEKPLQERRNERERLLNSKLWQIRYGYGKLKNDENYHPIPEYEEPMRDYRDAMQEMTREMHASELLAEFLSQGALLKPHDPFLIATEYALKTDEESYDPYIQVIGEKDQLPPLYYQQLIQDREEARALLTHVKNRFEDAILTHKAFGFGNDYQHGLYLLLVNSSFDQWPERIEEFMGEEIALYNQHLRSIDPEAVLLSQYKAARTGKDVQEITKNWEEKRREQPQKSQEAFGNIRRAISSGVKPTDAIGKYITDPGS